MSGSQRYRAAHKGTGRQTNDTGRRTKGIEGNRNELNAVHIQLCNLDTWIRPFSPRRVNVPAFRVKRSIHPLDYNFEENFN